MTNDTTTAYIGLLRGVNVGKAKRMPMAELKALVESLGWGPAKTLLNSGNVVFHGPPGQAAEAARCIEAALPAAFGFSARLTVLDAFQWANLLHDNPLLGMMTDSSRMLVAVWRHEDARARVQELARRSQPAAPLVAGRHGAYLWCPDGILASPVVAALDKNLRDDVTTRNWATALKIGALLQPTP